MDSATMSQYHGNGPASPHAESEHLCQTHWQDNSFQELPHGVCHKEVSRTTIDSMRITFTEKAATLRRDSPGISSSSTPYAPFISATARKVLGLVTIVVAGVALWNNVFRLSYATLPSHYQELERRVRSSTKSGRGNPNNEKVFVAANIVDDSLVHGLWGDNLVTLIDLLGEDNVFVSIYENDSGPGTSLALRELQRRLPCNSSVVTGDHIPLSDFPTVRLSNGEDRVQRLTYLAEVRNRLLRPLDPLYSNSSLNGFRKATHISFDRILFLNDVYYSPLEAVQLLFSTNAASGTAEYRAACALDFVYLFKLYDTFVVRDTDGYSIPLQVFPWFTRRGSGSSRQDVLNVSDAVRVRSCWGGMAAFDAHVFQPEPSMQQGSPVHGSSGLQLRFRSNGEVFWEAAECCLIFADMEAQYGRSTKKDSHGVFINPYIRTAYSPMTWSWLPFFRRFERAFELIHRLRDSVNPPEDNPRRTHEPGRMVQDTVWTGFPGSEQQSYPSSPNRWRGRVQPSEVQRGHFEPQTRRALPGGFCGERRMFVMKRDIETANRSRSGRNWESVHVPRVPSLVRT